jgi:Ni/Co efflux regulator RcnB
MRNLLLIAVVLASAAGGVCSAQEAQQSTQQQSSESRANSGTGAESMQQCMARQKATNSGLTQLQMQTTCKNQIKTNKTHREGNDLAT